MFVDQVSIKVKGGSGGKGAVSFRREKFVPHGGPDGGDGGKGGDVILTVDEGMRTLVDFSYQNLYKAEDGANGQGSNKTGQSGDDLYINVPPGTVVIDQERNEFMADLIDKEDSYTAARGGKGGRGNARFKSSKRQVPKIAENGEPGEEKEIVLELKMLADVGLVGFPNVGKSTLLSRVSAAKPKIDNYHFTTLEPNLGVVDVDDHRRFIMTDIPGLIEGAHKGTGLGIEFLRHVERAGILLHVLDISGREGRDPVDDFKKIIKEIEEYNHRLLNRAQVVACNKVDLISDRSALKELTAKIEESGYPVFTISAVTGEGIDKLMYKLAEMVEKEDSPEPGREMAPEFKKYEYDEQSSEKGYRIKKEKGIYIVEGELIQDLLEKVNPESEESIKWFSRRLRQEGVEDALKENGAGDGDTVRVGSIEFDYVE